MKNACLFYIVFISCYISRYHFSQIFRTSFSIISKQDFRHKFYFLKDSLKHPHPLNSQNLLRVTKVFCRCSLTPSRKAFFFEIKISPILKLLNKTSNLHIYIYIYIYIYISWVIVKPQKTVRYIQRMSASKKTC